MATRLAPPDGAVTITHDGKSLPARAGEPLALSLIAADRLLLSRSPKLHRPRGPYCLRGACEGCLVRVNGLPNQPACRTLVSGGEQVETQNVLGTRETDLLAATDFLFPQGIDHHRLLAGVRGISPLVGSFARRIAGLGKLADGTPELAPAERLRVEVLIVGGGRRGLSAARELGSAAYLVDDGPLLGGALTALDPEQARRLEAQARQRGARISARSTVLSLSREPDDGSGELTALVVGPEATRVLRCRVVLLAPGEHDAVPAFPNNDLPGIFSARAALWAWRGDVLIGQRLAVVGAGRYADSLVEQMSGAVELVRLDAEQLERAVGRERISAIEVRNGEKTRRIKVDALAFDGPGAPSFELAVQAGAEVDFDPRAGYVPRSNAAGELAPRVFYAKSDAALASVRELLRG